MTEVTYTERQAQCQLLTQAELPGAYRTNRYGEMFYRDGRGRYLMPLTVAALLTSWRLKNDELYFCYFGRPDANQPDANQPDANPIMLSSGCDLEYSPARYRINLLV